MLAQLTVRVEPGLTLVLPADTVGTSGACTASVAVVPRRPFVAYTVWAPPTGAEHVAPVQDPSGRMAKAVEAVTSPRTLLYWSNPWATYPCEAPEATVALDGVTV